MTSLLEDLRELGTKAHDSVFACHGRVILEQPVDLLYPSVDGTEEMEVVSLPGASDEELQQLVASCQPAYFGHGKEKVLDSTYRQAVMLAAERVQTSFRLAETAIIPEIARRLMTSSTSTVLQTTFHKMNVYGPGGFFKKHVDTPRAADTFGTLVVCVASPFEGGELMIEHGRHRINIDWSDAFQSTGTSQPFVQWAAFYSDCVHEVLPVKRGFRITLTYLLAAKPIDQVMGWSLPNHTLYSVLKQALNDPDFAPNGVKLGFALSHQYPINDWGEVPGVLKGADAIVKMAIQKLGLSFSVVPVYEWDESKPCTTPGDDEWGGDNRGDLYVAPDWKKHNGDWAFFHLENEDVDSLFASQLNAYLATDIVWIIPPKRFPMENWLLRYGNEETVDSIYAAACLVVKVAPSMQRLK